MRQQGLWTPGARLSAGLVRIVMNEALGRLRRRSALVLALDSTVTSASLPMEDPMESDPDHRPEPTAMRAELRRLIDVRGDALPEACRTLNRAGRSAGPAAAR